MNRWRPIPDIEPSRVPCLVVPNKLTFPVHNASSTSSKQVLTIYNAFDYPLRFRVLATYPSLYTVRPSAGGIEAKCSIDVFVKLNKRHISPAYDSRNDKIRVDIWDDSKSVAGQQVVPVLRRSVKACPENIRDGSDHDLKGLKDSAKISHLSSSDNSNTQDTTTSQMNLKSSTKSLPMFTQLLPFIAGIVIIGLLANGDIGSDLDKTASIWISFLIGIVTMTMQFMIKKNDIPFG